MGRIASKPKIDDFEFETEGEDSSSTDLTKVKASIKKATSFSLLRDALKKEKDGHIFIEGSHKNPVIPSGAWGFDYATGIGGAPTGRSIEFNGKESSGKTTLALLIAAQAQKIGRHVLFLDYEQALDTHYAASLGIDFDPELWSLQRPMHIEEGEKIFDAYMSMNKPMVIIQDSLPAMIPKLFLLDPESRIKRPGLQAKMQGEFFNKAVRFLAKTDTLLISLNQMRANMNMGGPAAMFASKDKASGSHANKHFQSQIFNISLIGKEQSVIIDPFEGKETKIDSYLKVRVTNKKNKVGRPYLGSLLYLKLGGSFDNMRNLCDAAINKGVIKKTGAWFSSKYFGDTKIQGMLKVCDFLRDNPDLVEEILKELQWIQEDGSMDLGSTYSKYNSNPLKDDDDDVFEDEDEEFED